MYGYNDFVLNGNGYGVGNTLQSVHYDTGLMRPYIDTDGRKRVTINTGKFKTVDGKPQPIFKAVDLEDLRREGYYNPVHNTTTLRKEDWILLDQVVLRAARDRLRAWADLEAANSFSVPGMSKMTLEYEAMSDPGEAVVDMNALTESRRDTPLFSLRSIPLPITHSDFFYDSRRLAVSANSGTPLDTVMAEAAGRRVAELIEQTTIGAVTGVTYGTVSTGPTQHTGTSTIYGYTNFPSRITKIDLTTPTGSNSASTVSDVLEMRQQLYDAKHYGPYMLYHGTDWDTYLDNDYYVTSTGAPYMTLRERLRSIEGIQDVRRLDYLTDTFTLLMVQMTSDVARAIVGMPITTMQWETHGGLKTNFKVMAIMVPQLRYDYASNSGILHATTA